MFWSCLVVSMLALPVGVLFGILLEHERYVPSLALALRIARVFGATVEEIFELAEASA